MRVLVACEHTGVVRDAFARRGHEAWSCDLLPSTTPGLHYQGDVRDVLDGFVPVQYTADCDPEGDDWCSVVDACPSECPCIGPSRDDVEYVERAGQLFGRPLAAPSWDLLIAHPPCTYLSASGMHWTTRGLRDPQLTEDALNLVRLLLEAPIARVAIENPISVISSRIRKPDQIIHPHQFGHDASKATCLWLRGLPKLTPTEHVAPRMVNGRPRWANQTDSGQNRLGPSPDRWAKRSATYEGIADAMAEQWSKV
jgi:hypothetical protein